MDVEKFSRGEFTDNTYGPFRSLDLRWLRCQYLLQHDRRPVRGLDDAIVFEARRYCRARSRCRTKAALKRLGRRFPGVADGYDFHEHAGPLRRAEMEGRLLADESDEMIAAKIDGISPAGVRAFHELFYRVRPFLKSDGYIRHHALRCCSMDAVAVNDQATWLHLFGYYSGPQAIDRLLDYFRNPPVMPGSWSDLDADSLKSLRTRLSTRLYLVTEGLPKDVNILKLFDLHRLADRRTRGLGGHSTGEYVLRCPVSPSLQDPSEVLGVVAAARHPVDQGEEMGGLEIKILPQIRDKKVGLGVERRIDMKRLQADPAA
jgi:hypothetical protein